MDKLDTFLDYFLPIAYWLSCIARWVIVGFIAFITFWLLAMLCIELFSINISKLPWV